MRGAFKSKFRSVSAPFSLLFVVASAGLFLLAQYAQAADLHLGSLKVNRILFLGNSITLTPPTAWCHWTGNWGMAASAADKDYVHLLVEGIAQRAGGKPEIRVVSIIDFEQQYATYDIGSRLKKQLEFKPDVVVVAIGENVGLLKSAESKASFKREFQRLLTLLKENGHPDIFVRSRFWPEPGIDGIMQQCTAAVGGMFIDQSSLGRNPLNYARSEDVYQKSCPASLNHPGDAGMRAIADSLFSAMTSRDAADQQLPGSVIADVQACLKPGQIHMGGQIGRRMADCMAKLVTAWELDRMIKPFRDKTDSPDDPLSWRCDYWGKWFTALAWGYAHEPAPQHRQLMDRAVKELLATAGPDGYIGSFAGQKRLVGGYDVWGRQCVILGLVAYYDLTRDKAALDAACRELDCLINELEQAKMRVPDLGWPDWKGLSPGVIVESGALLFQRTGLPKYRAFSERVVAEWSQPSKFLPGGLRLVEEALAGKPATEVGQPKGYQQMYCFIGLCELYRATGKRKCLDAAIALAGNIRAEELFVTGTGTERESWFKGRAQQTRVVSLPAETCVTAHWMYLCWHLLRLTGDPVYADELELSLDNALLGALMPDGHWFAAYSPLMGEREPCPVAQADAGLSCCIVSGCRALMLTPFWAVMQTADGPAINLYLTKESLP